MKNNLDIVDELYGTLNTLRPLKPEYQNRLDKKFRLEFNYNSNHIEGNTLTYGETELLLIFDNTLGNHNMREYEEIKAHDVGYHLIEELAGDSERPLTEQIIKNLNEIILVRPYWKDAITPDGQSTRRLIKVGDYKEFSNAVRLPNGEIFEYALPTETPILMNELIDWFRAEEKGLHPVTLATMLHYKFVRIHPFDDGNGRISRLLMNYVFLKYNYPPVIIKSADKDNYLRALHIADVGNYEPLVDYVAGQVIWSLKTSIKAAKGEPLEDVDDFIKEIEIIKRKASIKPVPKSLGVVYDTFGLINLRLWSSLLKTLKYFDKLFNETRDVHLINTMQEVFDSGLFGSLKGTGLFGEPKELKIFGHDIYKIDVRTIEWEHNMCALRGADKLTDVMIGLEIIFNNYNYKIRLKHYGSMIYETKKAYREALLDTDLEEINSALKKHLLEFIKERII